MRDYTNNNTNAFREVKKERNGWRCEWISERHRHFGWDCPMTDLDFPALEYNSGKAVCLIEYKHYNAQIKLNHPSMKAMTWMADKCEIPFFVVVYYPESNNYFVVPMNDSAKAVPHCSESKMWSERNYVKMLYWLRKMNCPENILAELKSNKFPEDMPMPNFI